MEKKGRGLPEVKRLNRVYMKEVIYKRAPVTRVEIAEELGLTLPTITTNVATMLAEGILEELPVPDAGPPSSQGGRKPFALDFKSDAAFALGVELGPYKTTVCVTDIHGAVVAQQAYPPAQKDYGRMLGEVTRQIAHAAGQVARERLLGAGVGLPGFIESDNGVIRSNLRPTWERRHLAQDLAAALNMPVVIDNNVRMRAIGEELFAKDWRPDSFAYYFISKGIACPLMIKADVVAGYTAGAGEIGHTLAKPGGPVCPTCGRAGCLDALAGETAILAACEQACLRGEAPVLRGLMEQGRGPLEMKTVLAAQELGDPAVCAVMDEAVEHLGVSLSNLVNLISPGLVIVDGYIMKLEQNQQRLLATATQNFYGLNSEEVRVEFLPFDLYRGARGAAARILRKEFLEK